MFGAARLAALPPPEAPPVSRSGRAGLRYAPRARCPTATLPLRGKSSRKIAGPGSGFGAASAQLPRSDFGERRGRHEGGAPVALCLLDGMRRRHRLAPGVVEQPRPSANNGPTCFSVEMTRRPSPPSPGSPGTWAWTSWTPGPFIWPSTLSTWRPCGSTWRSRAVGGGTSPSKSSNDEARPGGGRGLGLPGLQGGGCGKSASPVRCVLVPGEKAGVDLEFFTVTGSTVQQVMDVAVTVIEAPTL